MRFLFSVLGILFVVAVVGLLAKKQFASLSDAQRSAPASSRVVPSEGAQPTGPPAHQVQQVEKAVQNLMQQPRPMPEDK